MPETEGVSSVVADVVVVSEEFSRALESIDGVRYETYVQAELLVATAAFNLALDRLQILDEIERASERIAVLICERRLAERVGHGFVGGAGREPCPVVFLCGLESDAAHSGEAAKEVVNGIRSVYEAAPGPVGKHRAAFR